MRERCVSQHMYTPHIGPPPTKVVTQATFLAPRPQLHRLGLGLYSTKGSIFSHPPPCTDIYSRLVSASSTASPQQLCVCQAARLQGGHLGSDVRVGGWEGELEVKVHILLLLVISCTWSEVEPQLCPHTVHRYTIKHSVYTLYVCIVCGLVNW